MMSWNLYEQEVFAFLVQKSKKEAKFQNVSSMVLSSK